jgi:hypothetical protein
MTVIRKQNAIEVYAAKSGNFVVISEENGFIINERDDQYADVYINIDVAHIDSIIEALQNAKNEIIERAN